MINIRSKELDNLEVIGSGFFGTVYKVNDEEAYKIYHPTIKLRDGSRKDNPAIPHIKRKIKLFNRKKKRIKLSSLPDDYIIIDGKIGGIRIPYYNGTTVYNLEKANYSLKKDIAQQLVSIHTELRNSFIYPTDCHLDNTILVDKTVKLIDLDDELTYVFTFSNLIYQFISIVNLNENICRLFDVYNWPLSPDVKLKLQRKGVSGTTKREFPEMFWQERENVSTYLLVNSNSNLEIIKNIINHRKCRIIFLINKKEVSDVDLLKIIDSYLENGIEIYDFVDYDRIEDYLTNYKADNQFSISENDIITFHK